MTDLGKISSKIQIADETTFFLEQIELWKTHSATVLCVLFPTIWSHSMELHFSTVLVQI